MAEWTLADATQIRANLTKEQEDEISMLYRKVYLQVRKQMLSIPKDGTTSQQIQKQYLDKLHKQLDEAYKSLGVGLEKQIQKEAKKAAQGVVESSKKMTNKLGFKIEGAYSFVPKDVINALVTGQVYGGNWSLSGAIWADIDKKQSDISKVIAEGLAANKSAYDIAKDLETYVDPKAKKEWDWSKVYPGTSKKVDYNAQRLARTMISHAYQQSLERVCKNNPFVEGFIWQSAHSSRVCPICTERDGQFYKKGELPLDHPNGICTFIASIQGSMNDVADRLADWVNGKSDPELDKWYEDMTGGKATPVFNEEQKKWLEPLGYSVNNMPTNFKEFATQLSFDQQSELLSLAGGSWGSPHPYQLMEKYYKEHLLSVRAGVSAIQKPKKPPIGMSKELMEELFRKQDYSVIGKLSEATNKWWQSLTQEERDAVEAYTGSSYIDMNNFLRGIDKNIADYMKKRIQDCRSALNKVESPFDIVVGRGSSTSSLRGMLGKPKGMKTAIDDGELANWVNKNKDSLIGSIASDKGFLSTTPVEGGGFSGDITYRIFVPKGSHGAYVDEYSRHQGEREFLLQADGKFRVTDLVASYGNRVMVYMEYIPQK